MMHDLKQRPILEQRWLVTPVALLGLLLVLKVVYVYGLRIDSDETQHLHVVWAWSNGLLPYRDVFDNHSPLLQFLSSPLFRVCGERPDIVVPMRFAILPLYLGCLWLTFRIGEKVISRRVGLWASALVGAFPSFFIKTSEFRTDDLWALFWLLAIFLVIRGQFTMQTAFWVGLAVGAAFATSMKTTPLALGLLFGLTGSLASKLGRGETPGWKSICATLGVALCGTAIVPGLVIGFYAWKGALSDLYYCMIQYNVVLQSFGWARVLKHMLWFVPVAGITAAGAWFSWRAAQSWQRDRIAIVGVSLLGFFVLLAGFWSIVQPQTFLPVEPLLAILLCSAIANVWFKKHSGIIFSLLVLIELVGLVGFSPPRTDARTNKEANIAAVLTLTTKQEFVMDSKGETVFRRRPFYYVLEGITLRRLALGLMPDDIPDRLIATRTAIATPLRMPPRATAFILHNYMPVAFRTHVLGKIIDNGGDPLPKTYRFYVAVPERYAFVSEFGGFAGTLDGSAADAPRFLVAGEHEATVLTNKGRLALIWARAVENGFSPFSLLPDESMRPED